jgi:hypothetical protein
MGSQTKKNKIRLKLGPLVVEGQLEHNKMSRLILKMVNMKVQVEMTSPLSQIKKPQFRI